MIRRTFTDYRAEFGTLKLFSETLLIPAVVVAVVLLGVIA